MNIRNGGLRALTERQYANVKGGETQSPNLPCHINKDLGQNPQGKMMKKRQSFLFMSSWERSGLY